VGIAAAVVEVGVIIAVRAWRSRPDGTMLASTTSDLPEVETV
jgi:hypothetical protein